MKEGQNYEGRKKKLKGGEGLRQSWDRYRDWVSGLGIGTVCMIPLIGQGMVVEYHISALINE